MSYPEGVAAAGKVLTAAKEWRKTRQAKALELVGNPLETEADVERYCALFAVEQDALTRLASAVDDWERAGARPQRAPVREAGD